MNRFVATASGLSRRAADAAIEADRVRINNRIATLGDQIEPTDAITLDRKPLNLPVAFTHIILNKPVGYVSSRLHQGKSRTVYDLIPTPYHDLKLAGRLDRDSSGLIILSNDGKFIQELTHPSADKTKAYTVTLSRPLAEADILRLERGVQLEDGPSHITLVNVNGPRIELTIGEGRNRQLRRTFGAVGYDVVTLHRTRVGGYHLGNLKPGAWKTFAKAETAK